MYEASDCSGTLVSSLPASRRTVLAAGRWPLAAGRLAGEGVAEGLDQASGCADNQTTSNVHGFEAEFMAIAAALSCGPACRKDSAEDGNTVARKNVGAAHPASLGRAGCCAPGPVTPCVPERHAVPLLSAGERQHFLDLGSRNRSAEQIALTLVAVKHVQQLRLILRLDALGHDLAVERVRQRDD